MRRMKKSPLRMGAFVLAAVMIMTSVAPSGYAVNAAETRSEQENAAYYVEMSEVATPGDAPCIFLDEDGYYYYYVGGSKVTNTGWIDVQGDKDLAVKLDRENRIIYKAEVQDNLTYVSTYDVSKKEFINFTNNVLELQDKKLYYVNAGGAVDTRSGWYRLPSGTKVYVDANGYVTAKINVSGKSEKYSTYNYETFKWELNTNAWKAVDGIEYYYAGNGVAVYAYNTKTGKYTAYKNGAWTSVKSALCKLKDGKIYLTNANAVVVKNSGWYSAGTDKIYVGTKNYVAMKFFTKSGKLAKYNYSTKKWELVKKSIYKIGTTTYYFASNGVAVYAKDTNTGKITVRNDGKWSAVKNAVCRLDGGKIYLVNAKSVIAKKAGWYSAGTDKVYVGSKGYVTMRFNTKSGKLSKYNYSTNKWELIKVVSYKIGSKTYYFNSKGVAIVNGIAGNSKSGYFYVDKTGYKVNQREIQMAVNFIMANTNESMTTNQKLYKCFHILSEYPYMRDYVVPTDINRFYTYAADTFTLKQANCYRYSAAFACVATVLGYECRVTCGEVPNIYDTGMTIHGWTELWSETDKQWKVYDVRMHHNFPDRNYYNVFLKDYYPGRCVLGSRAVLTVKKGKVSWSWL